MKIKKLVTINWANIPNKEYDFSNLVFLTGETGVGKSTMLDAIQTLMTAAKSNIVIYNAGQDESQNRKRNKEYRTVQGYFSGEDRFKFSRPEGCMSTIAIVFTSSELEKEERTFTALVNASVSMEINAGEKRPKLDRMSFFIIKNTEINIADLTHENKILNHTELHKKLSSLYSKDNVILCNGRGDYLNTLYGNLWGKNSAKTLFAEKAAKAFSNFIHAKPVTNINAFIRNEFLESKDLKEQTNKLSDAIKSLNKLKDESNKIQNNIETLKELNTKSSLVLDKWFENQKEQYKFLLFDYVKQQEKIEKLNGDFVSKERKVKKNQKRVNELEKEIEGIDKSIRELESQNSNNEKMLKIANIEQRINTCKDNIRKSKDLLAKDVNTILYISNELKSMENFKNEFKELSDFNDLFTSFKNSVEEFFNKNYHIFLNRTIDGFEVDEVKHYENFLIELNLSFKNIFKSTQYLKQKEILTTKFDEFVARRVSIDNKLRETKNEIQNLEFNKTYCPREVLESFLTLKKLLPEANAYMLYEFVDLKDYSWQEAIEGYIGNNRFSVIVDMDYEVDAINIVRSKKLNLKIIQGSKVLREINRRGKEVDENSIVNLMNISNETAEAYLLSSYGNVLCVYSVNELKSTSRGVTIDCKAASNNLMFDCSLRDRRFIFGEKAKQHTLDNLNREYESLMELKNKQLRYIDVFSRLNNFLGKFNEKSKLLNSKNMDEFLASIHDLKVNEKQRMLIDVSDVGTIQKEVDTLTLSKKASSNELKGLLTEIGGYNTFLDNKEEILNKENIVLEEKKVSYEKMKETLNKLYFLYNENNSEFDEFIKKLEEEIDYTQKLSPAGSLGSAVLTYWERFKEIYDRQILMNESNIKLSYTLSLINYTGNIAQFEDITSFKKSIIEEKSRLESHILFKYKQKIMDADKNFKNIFMNDFCQAIYINIKQGESIINDLNMILKDHKFGDETFAIVTLEGDKELVEYKQYFKEIYELKEIVQMDSLFNEEGRENLKAITQKLMDLFMDNEKHATELDRISDYRNYSNYDIVQRIKDTEIRLSRNGKNSGGQGETSYYIIRSINLQAALKPKESNGLSLETVIIDESFLKSNEKRSKEILKYLTKTLNFQVICAMPTKQVGSFYDIDSINYHIVKQPLNGEINGELDYKIWVETKYKNRYTIESLFKDKEESLLEEIEKDAERVYAEQGRLF